MKLTAYKESNIN